MAKVAFGEYSAFTTKNNMVRYQKNNRLVSEKVVPPEVVAYLNKKLAEVTKFPMPTEEEKARLREESLKVKPELQRDDEAPSADSTTLEPADFEPDGSFNPEPTDEVIEAVASEIIGTEVYVDNEGEVKEAPIVDPDFLEQVSIHTAPLESMVQAMYERFGIYSIYLGRLPEQDEINPLTGEVFTKYHLGIAYQAAIRAQHTGILNKSPEANRAAIDQGREASANFKVDEAPRTMGEARRMNSFDYRTSVHGTQSIATTEIVHEVQPDGSVRAVQRDIPVGQQGSVNGASSRYDAQEDEPLVEPNFSGRPVIRPDW